MAHFYSGRDGEFSFDGKVIAKVASFSIQSTLETLETTTLGDNARTYTPGVLSYSGSATLLYYEDSGKMAAAEVLNKTFTTDAGGVTTNARKKLGFTFNNGSKARSIEIHGYITSSSVAAATGDIMRAEISFQGDGKLDVGNFS